MLLWASHPRVFLDVVNESEAMCPYCGTRYRLKRGAHVRAHEFDTRELHQDRTVRIARAVDVPVTADIEAGYSATPGDVAGTVRAVIEAATITREVLG
jgi:hypothetical protein